MRSPSCLPAFLPACLFACLAFTIDTLTATDIEEFAILNAGTHSTVT
jgi:hypothetical protein